jgi:hypothetical protein
MVKIEALTNKDIGRYVLYVPAAGKFQLGRLKSWNDVFIFVVYSCGFHWEKFECYTAEATSPEDLTFADEHVK